jgi:hypothetical protein
VGFVFATMTILPGSKFPKSNSGALSSAPMSSLTPSGALAIDTLSSISLAIEVVARMRC